MTPFFVIGAIGLVVLLVAVIADEAATQIFNALESDLFSGTVIGAFVTAFGFSGALAQGLALPAPLPIAVGVGTGAVFGAAALWATRWLMRSGNEISIRTADLVGHVGKVVTDIPLDGFGQITLVVDGHITRLSARAHAGNATATTPALQMYGPSANHQLAAGAKVTVVKVLSATAVEVEAFPDPQ